MCSVGPGNNRPSNVLMLHLLGRCNLECLHCYMEGSPQREEQLPVEPVLRAVGECQALGIGTLFLTGGEPLLYRGLDQVLETAAEATGLQTPACTNGRLLPSRQAARSREFGLRVTIASHRRPTFHD